MFHFIFKKQLQRSFYAVRVLEPPPSDIEGPLLCFANHPSWNDPMVLIFLHEYYFSERHCYGPIDAEALEGYGFMKKIGLYGVTHGNAGGARRFLRTTRDILDRDGTCIWITPQGRFADARERPPRFEPGMGALLRGYKKPITLLPVAIEYTYGEEKLPEVYVSFGQPVVAAENASADDWTHACEAGLAEAQDGLAQRVMARDPEGFSTILGGAVGVGGVYGFWQRLKAVVKGEKYDPSHGSLTDS